MSNWNIIWSGVQSHSLLSRYMVKAAVQTKLLSRLRKTTFFFYQGHFSLCLLAVAMKQIVAIQCQQQGLSLSAYFSRSASSWCNFLGKCLAWHGAESNTLVQESPHLRLSISWQLTSATFPPNPHTPHSGRALVGALAETHTFTSSKSEFDPVLDNIWLYSVYKNNNINHLVQKAL